MKPQKNPQKALKETFGLTDAEDTEVRFLVAKDKADKMTLEQLVELSEDFNVGYDIPEGMFEVMLKIPIEDLEDMKQSET